MVQATTYSKAIVFTCSLGIALCVYAFVVEERKSHDAKYEAVCDLNEHMSCSRVLTSQYAKGFGLVRHVLGEDSPLNVPNSIPGGAVFALFALLSFIQRAWTAKIQVGLALLTNVASIYLGCILYFVLKDFCIICVSTYVVCFVNLVLAYLRLRALTAKQQQAAGKSKGQQKSQKGQKGGKQQQQQQQQQQKSPQADKKKSDKPKSPQADKQKQNQQNGKAKGQQNDKQKSPNSKKKN